MIEANVYGTSHIFSVCLHSILACNIKVWTQRGDKRFKKEKKEIKEPKWYVNIGFTRHIRWSKLRITKSLKEGGW